MKSYITTMIHIFIENGGEI